MTVLAANAPLFAVGFLFLAGVAGLLFKRNLIKMLMAVTLIEGSVNLFLVALGYRRDAIAPIFTSAPEGVPMAMPTMQALTLTAIVIGLASTALMLSLAMLIYRNYGTTNITKMRKLKG